MSVPEHSTVLVVGGGPAGTTAATLLARQGIQVTLLEADTFPRYHIGESIQPTCLPIFDLMGVRDKVEAAGFIRKYGAFFRWGPRGEEFTIDFSHLETLENWGYQVIRSEFDKLLLDHAREVGVDVREGVEVRSVEFDGDRAVAARFRAGDATGRIGFDHLVDASGRTGVLANRQLRSRVVHDAYRNLAVWSYWRNVPRFADGPEGAVVIQSTPLGWFWVIPLHDGTTSVGLVTGKQVLGEQRARLGSVAQVYRQEIRNCPVVADLLADATEVGEDVKVDKDFCYAAESFTGPGYYLAGDAACFIDPLLTTGVHLATYSGLLAAGSIGSAVRGEVAQERASAFYEKAYRQSYERLLVLVSFLYQGFDRSAQLFEAERLTRRERQLVRLQESFLDISSGMEDLRDVTDASVDAVSTRMSASGHLSTQIMGGLPTSRQDAVGGLYLETTPVLRLREPASVTVS